MKTIYEYCIPRLRTASDARRLRGVLDMRSGLTVKSCNLETCSARIATHPGCDARLRAFLESVGFAPDKDVPAARADTRDINCPHCGKRPQTPREHGSATTGFRR